MATAIVADSIIDMLTNGGKITSAEINWMKEGKNNVILKVNSESELVRILINCNKAGIRVMPITESEFIGVNKNGDCVDIVKRDVIKAIAIGQKNHILSIK
jgi:hypothetical protein